MGEGTGRPRRELLAMGIHRPDVSKTFICSQRMSSWRVEGVIGDRHVSGVGVGTCVTQEEAVV